MKEELADVDGSIIKDLFIAGIILLLLWRGYRKMAVALQVANCFVEMHFASLKADNNFQFYFSFRIYAGLSPFMDYLALLALLISHR